MRILVFSRTTGYRHESIPAGIEALAELAASHSFGMTATEDLDAFTAEGLHPYAAVVFLNTSGDLFTDEQRAAFAEFVTNGGGFIGVHCAANTETAWPFFGDLLGARFTDHPAIQPATLRVEDRGHPATAHLDETWRHTDEWYNFDHQPRAGARILLSVDESSYAGGTMGQRHPIAWCYERSFYTALGHTVEGYAEPALRTHLVGAITWVTR
jgi:uncharacterized protein